MLPSRTICRSNSHGAFSVIEIVVVLAIFSAMVGVFVVGFSSLKDGFSRELELKDEVQQTIRRARWWSGKLRTRVFLWYPKDHSYLGITDDEGKELQKIDLTNGIPFQFLNSEENRELASLCVDPSGVITPFRLTYRTGNREFQTYKADIFSGQLAQMK
ncbi:MAG: type II secretion system GspH family protein [Puniceicoccales bacterium]|jgi:type II secretory pathway pseudopilin PulG|nr:type II secretion system GspH family protein [Puniceicoccales bacterium]